METQEVLNYNRIAKAIEYLHDHATDQPGLEDVAAHVGLSPAHFQRMFTEWTGTSPKKFLQYLTMQRVKQLFAEKANANLAEASYEAGLSSTSRLHDLFVSIEGMTPAEYKNGGRNLLIHYDLADSPFGHILVASTHKGVCYLGFFEEFTEALEDLKKRFPNAGFKLQADTFQQKALSIFRKDWDQKSEVRLHLKGTDFQLKVWECLLRIPVGEISTYGDVASEIGASGASRAVGTAVGSNPVSFLIPCHRVIRGDGGIGGYHWGTTRKTAILGWEAARSKPGLSEVR